MIWFHENERYHVFQSLSHHVSTPIKMRPQWIIWLAGKYSFPFLRHSYREKSFPHFKPVLLQNLRDDFFGSVSLQCPSPDDRSGRQTYITWLEVLIMIYWAWFWYWILARSAVSSFRMRKTSCTWFVFVFLTALHLFNLGWGTPTRGGNHNTTCCLCSWRKSLPQVIKFNIG